MTASAEKSFTCENDAPLLGNRRDLANVHEHPNIARHVSTQRTSPPRNTIRCRSSRPKGSPAMSCVLYCVADTR